MQKHSKNAPKLMGHIIAGYPDKEASLNAALGICEAGAKYLEIQFPFSDPNADGPIIEQACDQSIQQGFKIKDGFELASYLAQNTCTHIIIMTYANIIFHYGVKKFLKNARESKVWGIIVPDLPIENDENLRKLAKKYHINIISLIAPHASISRIHKLSKISDKIVYVVARAGITGDKTPIDKNIFKWIKCVKKHCKKPIALGFGINSNEQVQMLNEQVEIIVAGSYFVKKIGELKNQTPAMIKQELVAHTRLLMGWNQMPTLDSKKSTESKKSQES
ncbi:tryptophan synthase subunit alpha [Helicobacter sp. MIT 05-5293]|uniref:tryptophan synthase subunit alpha n=1 Tax=Helicobacter sp. MIT 05-5293 TaxID=1548149 RepID=UPI00068D98E0|nr:tryptophan synthase subunit alpha [Helicobacter sp. MIT 05-5293]TLD81994.1 tryptophan synthase subunit alpha [Helicobacter sp. MIT 05-5293]